MSRERRRLLAFVPSAVLLGGLLVWGLWDIPDFGTAHHEYARWLTGHVTAQRHVSNVVSGVVFDYRGWDTAGEEVIVFAAVTGTALLLRTTRDPDVEPTRDVETSDLTRRAGDVAVPLVVLVALWTASFGYVTPGGGFQGGVIAATAALLTWLTGSYRRHRALTPVPLVDGAEGGGVLGYLLIGCIGLLAGSAYLANVLPHGSPGALPAGGTIALLNWATGVAIAAAMVLIFHEFLEEHLLALTEREEGR